MKMAKPSIFTEKQNEMILAKHLSDAIIAERLGTSLSQVRRQRAKLKGKLNEMFSVGFTYLSEFDNGSGR